MPTMGPGHVTKHTHVHLTLNRGDRQQTDLWRPKEVIYQEKFHTEKKNGDTIGIMEKVSASGLATKTNGMGK